MQLTAEEFRAIVRQKPALNHRVVAMAKAMLVNGKTSAQVGDQFGVSRQAAHRAAQKIFRLHLTSTDGPQDWEVIQLRLPSPLITIALQLEHDALARFYRTTETNNLNNVDEASRSRTTRQQNQ